jgi:hypothetical protein
MKTILTKFLACGAITLLMLSACKKDGTIVTSNGGKAGTLTSSVSTLVLLKASLTDTTKVIKFSFTQADYGYSAAVTNTLQIDKPGDNFANPTSVTLAPKVLSQGYNTADFNSLLLKLGLAGGVSATVQVRVSQSISATTAPVYSNVLTLTVTPFNLTSWLYVVGQFNGYSTATPDSLLSATSNGIYTGVINFTAGNTRFLVLPAKNYNNKYATVTNPPGGTATSLTYATEYVTGGGNDLYAPTTPGFYVITLNTNTNSITVALTNTYSAIGATAADAGGYSIDVPLTKFINDGVNGWTGIVAFRAGDFKVRQNNDWTWSWGIPKAGSDGSALSNGLNDNSNTNIPIPVAGNYAVSFNIVPFPLGSTPAGSVPPTTTATYRLVKQ